MQRGNTIQMILLFALTLMLSVGLFPRRAQAQGYNVQQAKVYVKMDYWEPTASQSAEAWHFDPNNGGVWTQLPNDPTTPTAPPRAKFEVWDIFLHELMQEDYVWFIGVQSIKVVTGTPGSFVDVTDQPAYTEMIDRMIFAVDDPVNAGISPIYDPCGTRVWPIATGSELTPYRLYPHDHQQGGYGIRMLKHAQLESTAWHWENPAGVAQADVYIEFTILFDMVHKPVNAPRHQNVAVSWISAGGGCGYNFCLSQGQPTAAKIGAPVGVLNQSFTALVAAVPHVLDHTSALQLYWRHEGQNTLVIDSSIDNSNSHPAAHQCEPDGEAIPWHTHSSGSTGHLRPLIGLSAWQGYWELADGLDDEVFTAASFNIPTHTPNAPTDQRALYMVFWHGTILPEE